MFIQKRGMSLEDNAISQTDQLNSILMFLLWKNLLRIILREILAMLGVNAFLKCLSMRYMQLLKILNHKTVIPFPELMIVSKPLKFSLRESEIMMLSCNSLELIKEILLSTYVSKVHKSLLWGKLFAILSGYDFTYPGLPIYEQRNETMNYIDFQFIS